MASDYPILELNEATVIRSHSRILDRFSLSIKRDENTAIVGPNGSGKSTLIKLLTSQLHPLAHHDNTAPVKIFGKSSWDIFKMRTHLGIVSSDLQEDFIHNTRRGHISGQDVVISGFFSSLRLFSHHKVTGNMVTKASEALDRIGAGYLSQKMLDEMSTGEVQRVLIARALVHDPEVLVFDEPTTGLDLVARHKCISIMRKIAREGTTVILITHHIEEIIPEIGRVILLQKGTVAFDGPKREVLTSDKLSNVYSYPVILEEKAGFYEATLNHEDVIV